MMRVVGRISRAAAIAAVSAAVGACVVPPPGVAPRPSEYQEAAPEVALSSFDSGDYNSGSGLLAYSVTRDAYAAVFAVDRQGKVRVLAPGGDSDDEMAHAGRSYVVYPPPSTSDVELANLGNDYARLPYVFVVTADEPLDLSMFGRPGHWSRSIAVDAATPDSAVAAVARVVAQDAPDYGADYAYVSPQLYAGQRSFMSRCARPVDDVHDYWYFRELWAVFTPYDPLLGATPQYGYGPLFGWASYSGSYAFLPFAALRAQLAPRAFYTGFCPGDPTSAYGLQYADASMYNPYGYYSPYSSYYGVGLGLPWAFWYPTGGWLIGGPGVVAVMPNGRTVAPPTGFRPPRTPNAIGTQQASGGPGAPSPNAASGSPAVRAFRPGPVGERLAWRLGPSAPVSGQAALTTPRPSGFFRPLGFTTGRGTPERGFERQPVNSGWHGANESRASYGGSSTGAWRTNTTASSGSNWTRSAASGGGASSGASHGGPSTGASGATASSSGSGAGSHKPQ